MKSRQEELIDRSLAAMVSAIEIYNKPDFKYRGETFSILAINSWELLFKAKWLTENDNKINALYEYENKSKKEGGKSRRGTIKKTRSGNPKTLSMGKIANKLIGKGLLNDTVWNNIQTLMELRDSSIHFYRYDKNMSLILQELGTATIKKLCSDY